MVAHPLAGTTATQPAIHERRSASVLLIGAGGAGLATSYYLQRQGIDHLILEQQQVGATWTKHYDRLHLHTLKQVSGLPGLPMPADYPTFPAGEQVSAYLRQYAAHFALPVIEGIAVQQARYEAGEWHVQTSQGTFCAALLVVATGIWHTPYMPHLAGQEEFGGRIVHANVYDRPQSFAGQRVLVVGVGNSGTEIAVDLGEHGIETGIATRSGVTFVRYPRSPLGMRLMAWFFRIVPQRVREWALRRVRRRRFDQLGLPPASEVDAYPVVGFELPEAVAAGQVQVYGGIERLLPGQVQFADGQVVPFDTIIMATGYRPTVGFVQDELDFDAAGFPLLDEGRSTRNPQLYTVGFRYPTTEGWFQSIGYTARRVARRVARHARKLPHAAAR
jgi:cation diffusion facilitator CzcD-associated flavoprotein CzcO